jgi:putative drug exporter of the RND superfamily
LRNIADIIIKRKKTVLIIWALAFLALTPLILNYSHFVSYTVGSKSLSDSESARAQAILSQLSPQNSSLIVVFQPEGQLTSRIANETLAFQNALEKTKIPFYSSSSSAFSSYMDFLDSDIGENVSTLFLETYSNFSSLSDSIYVFPSSFLGNWSLNDYSQSSIATTATNSGYNPDSSYESGFLRALNQTFSPNNATLTPRERIQTAIKLSATEAYENNPLVYSAVSTPGFNITDYKTNLTATVAGILSAFSGFQVTTPLLQSVLNNPSDPGLYYVNNYGLLGAPAFITQDSVSADNTTYLVTVSLNVSESFRGSNNFYPAQNLTGQLEALSQKYFGINAKVTGQGAIAYDTQNLSAGSGFVFAFTFIFLAIAVGIVLTSLLSPLLALVFVSIATALGYVAIFLTGTVLGSVDYTVTYTLTAVILGVSTDYFIFILSRYKEELRAGKSSFDALKEATSKAGYAVVVSGITVAGSLGALSFVSGLESWGPVLFISIILTVALETTLLPAVVSLVGPRVFLKRTLSRTTKGRNGRIGAGALNFKSFFYRTTKFSEKRKYIVVGVIVLLAIPAVYFWFTVPTTYNFNEGLPKNLQSVQGLNTINQKFEGDLIYPSYVIVNFTQNALSSNGNLVPFAESSLQNEARYLLSVEGVRQVIGPEINGTNAELTSDSSQFVFNNGKNAYFIVFTGYDPYSKQAISLVNDLRENSSLIVGGLTSSVIDQENYYATAYSELEILILFVIGIVLGISFRSIKYPFISLSGVFISITWTTSLLYVISRYLLGQELVFLIPIVLYVILMSLGNDFTVFILSRVKEEQGRFGFSEGLVRAMVGSGAVVTALGLILAASLGSLALVPFGFLEQLGIAFVISLVLDTFVIRTLYFPAMITLLGRKTALTQDPKAR